MENQRTQNRVAMQYGAFMGLCSIFVFLLFYFSGVNLQSKLPQVGTWIVMIIFLVLGIKSYRDNELNGYMTYGKSVGTGSLIAVYAGIISAFFTLLFFTQIDPNMVDKIIEMSQKSMAEKGMNESDIEMATNMSRKFMTPTWFFLFSFLSTAFMGLIFSLIISVFTRKEENPFNTNIG
jgi:ABC-type polysaccharide/polyol phosphate export permease